MTKRSEDNRESAVAAREGTGFGLLSPVAALLLAAATGCKEEKAPPVAAEKPVPVSVEVLKTADVPDRSGLPGILVPWSDVTVSAEQAGRVTGVRVAEGDSVTNGQVLATLDRRLVETALRRAELALRDASDDLKRWTELAESGSVTAKEVADLKSRREQAEIAVAEQRVRLSQCGITSPLDGIVEEKHVEEGEYVGPGTPAFRVVDVHRLKLVVSVPEQEVLNLRSGMRLPFEIDALPGGSFEGEVCYVSSASNPASNSYRMELAVPNEKQALRAGLICKVIVSRQTFKDALSVPLSVLVPEKKQFVAYVVENNVAIRRVVRLRSIVGSDAVVESGLRAGECLVVEGQRHLADGLAVEIVPKRK